MKGANQSTPEPDHNPALLNENDDADNAEENSPQGVFDRRLALFNEVGKGEFEWKSEDRVRELLHGSPEGEPETILHQLIDYLRQHYISNNTKPISMQNGKGTRGGEAVKNLEDLARFALNLEPALLKTSISRGRTTLCTPLQYVIENPGKRMERFAKFMCEVALKLPVKGRDTRLLE